MTFFVRLYMICVQTKESTGVLPGLLQLLPVLESHFSLLSIDFTTYLPLSHGFNKVFTCMDYLTKYIIIIPYKMNSKTLTSTKIAQLLFTHVLRCFGVA